jgi:hypothetical protein
MARWFPGDRLMRDTLLVCATEVTSDEEIARFAHALREVLRERRPEGVVA